MKRFVFLTLALVLAAGSGLAQPGYRSEQYPKPISLAPFVPMPKGIVEQMLTLANVQPTDVVFDLGCGDGRVLFAAAQRFNVKRAVGVEISPRLVESVNRQIQQLNLAHQVSVIHDDMMNVDLSEADVVVLYLLTSANELLRPRLEKFLKPGARVVSHDYAVRGWKAAKTVKIPAFNRDHVMYLYEMPRRAQ